MGLLWARFNSRDEADTELKPLIVAGNEEVRPQGRGTEQGLETPRGDQIPLNKDMKPAVEAELLLGITHIPAGLLAQTLPLPGGGSL